MTKIFSISFIFLLFSATAQGLAQPGAIDLTFGTSGTGRMIVDIRDGHEDRAQTIALQPDGKILVAGMTTAPGGPSDMNFFVVRFNSDGSVDPGFGVNGRTLTDFRESLDVASGIAVQPDGKIVVAGSSNAPNGDFNIALTRYNPDGIIDTTFGDNAFGPGRVLTDVRGGSADDGNAIVLQPDGKIVIAGTTDAPGPNPTPNRNVVLVRYSSNGIIDTTFGNNPDYPGRVLTALPNGAQDVGVAAALQTDGKIVVAGTTNAPVSNGDDNFLVLRYTSDGVLDPTFGVNGGTVTDMRGRSADQAYGIVIQRDGKIVVAGITDAPNGDKNFATVRYLPNGVPDDPFGGSNLNPGRQLTDFGNRSAEDYGVAVALDPAGRIVVAGTTRGKASNNFGVVRYNESGIPLTGFGSDNRVRTNIGHTPDGAESEDTVDAVAFQADGKVIVAGDTNAPNGDVNIALVRYITADPRVPYTVSLSKKMYRRTSRMRTYYFDGYVRNQSAAGLNNRKVTLTCTSGSRRFSASTRSSGLASKAGWFRFQVTIPTGVSVSCRAQSQGVGSRVVSVSGRR